jgi:hypothetical protein
MAPALVGSGSGRPVAKGGGNGEESLAANFHAGHALIPTFDDLATTEHE